MNFGIDPGSGDSYGVIDKTAIICVMVHGEIKAGKIILSLILTDVPNSIP